MQRLLQEHGKFDEIETGKKDKIRNIVVIYFFCYFCDCHTHKSNFPGNQRSGTRRA